MSAKNKFKILIADDHSVVRCGMAIFCEEIAPGCEILESDSLDGVFKVLKDEKDVKLLILDVYFGVMSSIQQIGILKSLYPNLKILVISMGDDEIYGVMVMREGVQGYINKMSDGAEIKKAIRTVMLGEYYLSPQLQKVSAGMFSKKVVEVVENPFHNLSSREFHVCVYMLKGMDVYEIAEKINLNPSTVSTYKGRLMTKLGVKRISDLHRIAVMYNISF